MRQSHLKIRHLEEYIVKVLMVLSLAVVVACAAFILFTILYKGLPALNWAMITQTSSGGYYLGQQGGILNAILGSIYLAGGGTLLALIPGIPLALFLHTDHHDSAWVKLVQLSLDTLTGIPSIVYGAFGFTIMVALRLRASLLAGIITLAFLELPILTRAINEVIRMVPEELEHASLGLGATVLETKIQVVVRQILPGLITAVQLAFGRAIGDAASVLFTAGYTDRIPVSLFQPVASLPLAVFYQMNTPFPAVQQRAYASALLLTLIVLVISLGSRLLSARLSRFIIK
ncbi:MAG TPA: ABC transporter permease subunit [Anaerolineaceae bacterium]|nr:ABC transporter permease subunit [Anaerolineaceae bacterium]